MKLKDVKLKDVKLTRVYRAEYLDRYFVQLEKGQINIFSITFGRRVELRVNMEEKFVIRSDLISFNKTILKNKIITSIVTRKTKI